MFIIFSPMKLSSCTQLPCHFAVLLNFLITILLVDLIKLACDVKGGRMFNCLEAAGSPVIRQHCFWYHPRSLDSASARL
jgi:heme/copper-type cytochrome/quinol oxidase subunit 1